MSGKESVLGRADEAAYRIGSGRPAGGGIAELAQLDDRRLDILVLTAALPRRTGVGSRSAPEMLEWASDASHRLVFLEPAAFGEAVVLRNPSIANKFGWVVAHANLSTRRPVYRFENRAYLVGPRPYVFFVREAAEQQYFGV